MILKSGFLLKGEFFMRRNLRLFSLTCALFIAVLTQPVVCAANPIRVAFIDTGISTKYLDADRVAQGKNYAFPERDTEDRDGHGTATAGMMLGSSQLGLEGSCPDAVAVPLVTYDYYQSGVIKNSGVSALCEAIYDAVDVFDCSVINISMGVPSESEGLRQAAEYAEKNGVVVVSAVGNDNLMYPERKYYPAVYRTVIGVGAAAGTEPEAALFDTGTTVIGVGAAVGTAGAPAGAYTAADFSQRKGVSVLAKGADVEAVTNRNEAKSRILSGTSYASGYVAGACARLLVQSPLLTPAQVRALLYAEAQDICAPWVDEESGWGLVGPSRPDHETLTRGMFTALLYTAAGEPESRDSAFSDVPQDNYCAKAIAWAAEIGIVNGCGDGRFHPYDDMTLEQIALILYRYAQNENCGISFGDETDIKYADGQGSAGGYSVSAVRWALDEGLIGSGGDWVPQRAITRAKSADILRCFFENNNKI